VGDQLRRIHQQVRSISVSDSTDRRQIVGSNPNPATCGTPKTIRLWRFCYPSFRLMQSVKLGAGLHPVWFYLSGRM
jgi:hypothetical protein